MTTGRDIALGLRAAYPWPSTPGRRHGSRGMASPPTGSSGIKSAYHESPDTAQEWQSHRRSLRRFAPLLFRD
jgi:hypothetical protein